MTTNINVPAQITNIDWLRRMSEENKTPPHWFGLGFIQLKLTSDTRIHFWLPWLRSWEREEIHNHRYNFTSRVLRGSLHKEIYSVERALLGDHELFVTDCAPGAPSKPTDVVPVICRRIAEFDLEAESTYWFAHDQFHTTEGTDFAITYLEREPRAMSHAQVVKLKGALTNCPFGSPLPVDDIWQHIERALLL